MLHISAARACSANRRRRWLSAGYADKGHTAWSAFECSVLAGVAADPKEQERLFKLGYSEGKAFIDALQRNAISKNDLDNKVPLPVLQSLAGPTPDFMLGKIFEASTGVVTPAYKAGAESGDQQLAKNTAQSDFWKKNCNLIR